MTAGIRSIARVVPPAVLRQTQVRDLLRAQPGVGRLAQRLIGAAFDASAIDTRHTVLDELALAAAGRPTPDDAVFARDGTLLDPLTGARNDVYAAAAPGLFVAAGGQALAESGFAPEAVTHVVTVSCTGFIAPGPDYALLRGLGLRTSVERFHLGFMGCSGAFPALRAARQFCLADPDAVVLVVCVELCTLHVQARTADPDRIVAASVFADGAAACVVSARPAPGRERDTWLAIDATATTVTDTGEDAMAWSIGDHGFEMVLSSYVPHIIEGAIAEALSPMLAHAGGVHRWAIHPGGRSVLDRVQRALELGDDDLAPSRAVLREFGNVSSATVLFILRDLLRSSDAGQRIGAVAFGPGLTVDSAVLTVREGQA